MHLMTFDPYFDLICGHPTWQQGKISSGMFADISNPGCLLFHKLDATPRITSHTTTLKCTWWSLTLSLTFVDVTKLGNRAKSVQECLLLSKSLVAPYSAKVQTNPKITSQITNLKCTWGLLAPILILYEVTHLGNWTKSVQECLLMSISLVAPYSAEVHTDPKITPQTTTLKCTWPLTAILTLYEVTHLGKISSGMFADIDKTSCPYAAEVPTNPKITCQTTSLYSQWHNIWLS